MEQYIEREKVYQDLRGLLLNGGILTGYHEGQNSGIFKAMSVVRKASAADVRPERYSEWIERNGIFECKECGYTFEHEGYIHFFIYCPCCGAKMGTRS